MICDTIYVKMATIRMWLVGLTLEEINMKKLALAAAFSVAASTAFAGGMAEPVMEGEVVQVVEGATSSSSGGVIIPLLLLLLVAAAVSGGSSSGTSGTGG